MENKLGFFFKGQIWLYYFFTEKEDFKIIYGNN